MASQNLVCIQKVLFLEAYILTTIHTWTVDTLQGWFSFHDIESQGLCLVAGKQVKLWYIYPYIYMYLYVCLTIKHVSTVQYLSIRFLYIHNLRLSHSSQLIGFSWAPLSFDSSYWCLHVVNALLKLCRCAISTGRLLLYHIINARIPCAGPINDTVVRRICAFREKETQLTFKVSSFQMWMSVSIYPVLIMVHAITWMEALIVLAHQDGLEISVG